MDHTLLIDQIETMLRLESTSYATLDYMDAGFQSDLAKQQQEREQDGSLMGSDKDGALETSSLNTSTSSSSEGMKEIFREKIIEWMYQVVDHFNYSREVVAIALNYIDRYLSQHFVGKRRFQLLAMAGLCLAVKLFEPSKLTMQSMIGLSRGYFTLEQLEEMETNLVRDLKWQLHPPTSYTLSKLFLYIIPLDCGMSMEVRHDVLEISRFLNELAVIDYFFVTQKPSNVAIAAIANAMQDLVVPQETIHHFMLLLQNLKGVHVEDPGIVECRQRMRILYAQGGYTPPVVQSAQHRPDTTPSPVCVSYGTDQHQPTTTNAAPPK